MNDAPESRLYGNFFKITVLLIIIAEFLSVLGESFPLVNTVIFFLVFIGVLLASLRRLEYGFWVALTEVVIGSFGYLFSYTAGSFRISVRLAIFIAVMIAWAVTVIRRKNFRLLPSPFWKYFAFFIVCLGIGVVTGLARHHGLKDVFLDANGYLYYGLLFVAFSVITNRRQCIRCLQIVFAATTVVAAKTIFLLFYFSHQVSQDALRFVYSWVRDTRVGEISPVAGDYYRIFFQSHLWTLVALITVAFLLILVRRSEWSRPDWRLLWLLTILSSTTILISFSRSIWLALGVSVILSFIFLLVRERYRIIDVLKIGVLGVLVLAIDLALITAIVNVRLPGGKSAGISAASLVSERLSGTEEPALRSRFSLLQPLLKASMQDPVIGQGFAAPVTYQTLDPRTKDENGGQFTTYSFEWGYLDILLKIGLLGFVALAMFLFIIIKRGSIALKNTSNAFDRTVLISLLVSLFALLAVHATTPYLNHPIGIMLVIVAASFFFQPATAGYEQPDTPSP